MAIRGSAENEQCAYYVLKKTFPFLYGVCVCVHTCACIANKYINVPPSICRGQLCAVSSLLPSLYGGLEIKLRYSSLHDKFFSTLPSHQPSNLI